MEVMDWPDGVNVSDIEEMCATIGYSMWKRYRKYVELPDLRQELMLFSWRKRDKVAEYLVRDEEENPIRKRQGEAAYLKSLTRAAERYCRKMKAQVVGYSPRDEFFYTRTLLEDLIGVMVNGMSDMAQQVDERVKVSRDPSEGGNTQAMMADLKRALDTLDHDAYAMVMMAFGDQVPTRVIAETWGITRQAVEQRLERTTAKLVRALGGDNPY